MIREIAFEHTQKRQTMVFVGSRVVLDPDLQRMSASFRLAPIGPEELRKVKLYESPGHQRNFLDCVKSRQPSITPVETAHHSAIPGHLGLIAMLVGRKINWDVAGEKIIGDPEASKLLLRAYRPPWQMG